MVKRTKKKQRKRRRRKGVRRNYGTSLVRSVKGAMPTNLRTKLKFHAVGQMVGAAITNIEHDHIRLNSIYSPSFSAEQPRGRDQLVAFYSRYRVDRVDCIVTCHLTAKEYPGYGMDFSINLSNADRAEPSSRDMAESALAVGVAVPLASPNYPAIATAQGQTWGRKKFTVYPNRVTGVSMAKYRAGQHYSALTGADPTEHIQMITAVSDVYNIGQTFTAIVSYDLVYHVEFFDPIAIASS